MAEQSTNPLDSLPSLPGLSGNALKGARIGGQKSQATGTAAGNVTVGSFNVTPWTGKKPMQWQTVAIAGAVLVALGMVVVLARK